MDIAKWTNAVDEYIELDCQHPEAQWKKLKDDNLYGFDVVVDVIGVEKLVDKSINYVRRGGTLMICGVYENKVLVHWPNVLRLPHSHAGKHRPSVYGNLTA